MYFTLEMWGHQTRRFGALPWAALTAALALALFTPLRGWAEVGPAAPGPSTPLGSADNPIRAGVVLGAPFAYVEEGQPTGIAVALFQDIAAHHGWSYELHLMGEHAANGIHAITADEIDLLVGPISVTAARLAEVSFTRPFFFNMIGVAVSARGEPVMTALDHFASEMTLGLVLLFIGIVLAIAHAVWFFEYRGENSTEPRAYVAGVLTAVWGLIVHFLHGGYRLQHSRLVSRLAQLSWLLLSILLATLFTAWMSAAMTTDMMASQTKLSTAADLRGKRLGYVEGQALLEHVKQVGAFPVAFPSLKAAMAELNSKDHDIDGVVADLPILRDARARYSASQTVVTPLMLAGDEFAFALPYQSTLRRPIDLELVRMQDSQETLHVCQRYLGDDAKNCQL